MNNKNPLLSMLLFIITINAAHAGGDATSAVPDSSVDSDANIQNIRININGIGGPRCTIEARPEWNIDHLKFLIQEQIGVVKDNQSLVLGTEKLHPDTTVSTLLAGLPADTTILDMTLVVETLCNIVVAIPDGSEVNFSIPKSKIDKMVGKDLMQLVKASCPHLKASAFVVRENYTKYCPVIRLISWNNRIVEPEETLLEDLKELHFALVV